MKETLISRFNKLKSKDIGSIVTLAQTIYGQNYRKQEVITAFNKFVPKNEYDKEERDDIINWLLERNELKNK